MQAMAAACDRGSAAVAPEPCSAASATAPPRARAGIDSGTRSSAYPSSNNVSLDSLSNLLHKAAPTAWVSRTRCQWHCP